MKTLLVIVSMFWLVSGQASPVDDFEQGFADGTALPGSPVYEFTWLHSTDRRIHITDRVETDRGVKGKYTMHMLWDGQPSDTHGVIDLYIKDGKVYRAVNIPIKQTAAIDVAAAGQTADVASTGIALSQGFVEANPLGVAILPGKILLLKHSKTLPLGECVKSRELIGKAGWGAAAANIGLVLGGPVTAIAGALGGWFLSAKKTADDAPARCVEA